jgi:hypothetical protein
MCPPAGFWAIWGSPETVTLGRVRVHSLAAVAGSQAELTTHGLPVSRPGPGGGRRCCLVQVLSRSLSAGATVHTEVTSGQVRDGISMVSWTTGTSLKLRARGQLPLLSLL